MKKVMFLLGAILVISVMVPPSSHTSSFEETEVSIKTVSPFAYCCIHHKGSYSDIEKAITQLFSTMQSQNIPTVGNMIGVYFNSPEEVAPEDLEWEIGFLCSAHVSPISPLEKKVWDFEQVATAIHRGPYEKTGETYTEIFMWMETNGYVKAGPVLEKYLNMPTQDADPETLQAEIWVPAKTK